MKILHGRVAGGVEEKIRKGITGLIKILSLPLRTINKCDMYDSPTLITAMVLLTKLF